MAYLVFMSTVGLLAKRGATFNEIVTPISTTVVKNEGAQRKF